MDVYSAALANGIAMGSGRQPVAHHGPIQPHLQLYVRGAPTLTTSSQAVMMRRDEEEASSSTLMSSAKASKILVVSPPPEELNEEDMHTPSGSPTIRQVTNTPGSGPSVASPKHLLPHQKLGLPPREGGSRLRAKLTNGGNKGGRRGAKGRKGDEGAAGERGAGAHLTLEEVLGQRRSIKVDELLTAIGIDYDQLDISDDYRFTGSSTTHLGGANVSGLGGAGVELNRNMLGRPPANHPGNDSSSRRPSVATAEGGNSPSGRNSPTALHLADHQHPVGHGPASHGRSMLGGRSPAPPSSSLNTTSSGQPGHAHTPRRGRKGSVPQIKFPSIPAPDAAPSAWKCSLCTYHLLSMDHNGRPIAFGVDAWGAPIPVTCPKCLVHHLAWTPQPLFDTFGDHANIIAKTANVVRYGAQRHIAPTESVFNHIRRGSTTSAGSMTPMAGGLTSPSHAPLQSALRKVSVYGESPSLMRSHSTASSNNTEATLLPMRQQQLPFMSEGDSKSYQLSLGRPHPLAAHYFDDECEEGDEGNDKRRPRGRRSIYAPLPGPLQGLANLIPPQEGDMMGNEAPSRLRLLYKSAFDTPAQLEGSGVSGSGVGGPGGGFGGFGRSVMQSHSARPPSSGSTPAQGRDGSKSSPLGNTFFAGATFADDLQPRTPRSPHHTNASDTFRRGKQANANARHSTPFFTGEWKGGETNLKYTNQQQGSTIDSSKGTARHNSSVSVAPIRPFPSKQVAIAEKLRGRRWAFQCLRCGHRLHRMDAYGFLIPLDTGIDGKIIPLQCGGCGDLHADYVVSSLTNSTKTAEAEYSAQRRKPSSPPRPSSSNNSPLGGPLNVQRVPSGRGGVGGAFADAVVGMLKESVRTNSRGSKRGGSSPLKEAIDVHDGSYTHRPL